MPSVTSGLGSATGPVVGKYSAATHQPRGPRRQTWCRRGAGSRPPACGDTWSPPGCHPPGEARGRGPCCRACSTSSPQAVSRPGQPGHPRRLGWADKTVSQCQEPVRLVDKSGHCPPLPGLSQAVSEWCLRTHCSPGRLISPQDPSPSPGDPRMPASALPGDDLTQPGRGAECCRACHLSQLRHLHHHGWGQVTHPGPPGWFGA